MNRFMHVVPAFAAVFIVAGCVRDEPQQQQPNYANNQGPYGPGYQGQPPPQPGQPYQPAPQPGQPYQPAPQPGQYQPAPQPGQPAPVPGQPFPQPGQPAPAPGQPAPDAGTIPGLPFPLPFPLPGAQPAPQPGGGAGSAQPIDPNLATVATIPLLQMQQSQAPGMTKEGPPVAGNFQPGQSLETQIQLLPNKCYTILGVGAGVQELDIKLIALTPIPNMNPLLAEDKTTGSNAALGGGGQCFRWQLPVGINAKWIMTAVSGQGVAAGQVYVK